MDSSSFEGTLFFLFLIIASLCKMNPCSWWLHMYGEVNVYVVLLFLSIQGLLNLKSLDVFVIPVTAVFC